MLQLYDMTPSRRKKNLPPCWSTAEAAAKFGVPHRQLTTLMSTTGFKPTAITRHAGKDRFNSIEMRKWWASLTAEQRVPHIRSAL